MEKIEDREQKFLSKIERKLETISGKLQEIHESVSKRINGVEERVSHLEKSVDGKLVMMGEKINNLQSQRSEPVRVVSESTARIKPPCYDGSSPLSVFKFQF